MWRVRQPGSKGKTREGFHAELVKAAGGLKQDVAKAKVVELLRNELKKDVDRMKTVVKFGLDDESWATLKQEVVKEAKEANLNEKVGEENAKDLKKEIGERIIAGENQVASQPFDF